MSDVLIPGGRDVRGTLEVPADDPSAVVVACPPHPQHGGSRSDPRLAAVSETLSDVGIACLRIDYGPWDDGYGEREDVRNAIRWADEQYDGLPVGVFGYSFGAAQALLAAADVDREVAAVSVLAPPTRLDDDLDALAALEALACPVQLLYGERDSTVDCEPLLERARERGDTVTALSGDHFFVGQHGTIADAVGDFLEAVLLESA
ncbi:alpha/beta hydrolase [Natronorubrum sulfidifaciens]|uniref:Alpha/beta hydrolase n=1 Tax=Natronorubrum sulfidifaciens JCM 14089 TaxID=1230460 RepID=L9W8N2_9EURY|nr:dienelactone hydrolase family protein [Natronorubrum sulfidifaciens]ELY44683.1 alpha/beta hydrolase [Natronorubrum sulfidifaciens JCM 14089]